MIIDIITIVLSVAAIVFSIITFSYTKKTEKTKQTIEAYKDLQCFLYCLYEYKKNEIEDFVTDTTTDEYKMLSNCIAHLEIFATGINQGIYDFEIVYSMAHGYIDKALKGKIEYLLDMKSRRNEDSYYNNTKWLLAEMEQRENRERIR